MTIIPRNALSLIELDQLGNNFDEPLPDQDQVDAMNRSLQTLGEAIDDQVELAVRSEYAAG